MAGKESLSTRWRVPARILAAAGSLSVTACLVGDNPAFGLETQGDAGQPSTWTEGDAGTTNASDGESASTSGPGGATEGSLTEGSLTEGTGTAAQDATTDTELPETCVREHRETFANGSSIWAPWGNSDGAHVEFEDGVMVLRVDEGVLRTSGFGQTAWDIRRGLVEVELRQVPDRNVPRHIFWVRLIGADECDVAVTIGSGQIHFGGQTTPVQESVRFRLESSEVGAWQVSTFEDGAWIERTEIHETVCDLNNATIHLFAGMIQQPAPYDLRVEVEEVYVCAREV